MRRLFPLLFLLILSLSALAQPSGRFRESLDDMTELSPDQRAFFHDWRGFEPWNRRRGESVPAFLASRHNVPSDRRDTLVLETLGVWPAGLGRSEMEAFLQAFFQMQVEIRPHSSVRLPAARRGKYSAESIRRELRRAIPANAFAVLALADVDIYTDDTGPEGQLFGQGHYTNRTAVASLSRLRTDDRRLLHHRAFKLVAHELCHTFGLKHCGMFRCMMNPSRNVVESDRRPLALCPPCLRKLHAAVGFDPVERYRDLLPVLAPALSQDGAWLRERLESLD